jgi:hypothetical protein
MLTDFATATGTSPFNSAESVQNFVGTAFIGYGLGKSGSAEAQVVVCIYVVFLCPWCTTVQKGAGHGG